jgi:hypothetical protein
VNPRLARTILAELDVLAAAVLAATRYDLLTVTGRKDFAVALAALDHQIGYLQRLARPGEGGGDR